LQLDYILTCISTHHPHKLSFRYSWTPVNLNRDNLFDHYDFHNVVPDPLTGTSADTDPAYLTPRPKNLRECDLFKKLGSSPSPIKDRPKPKDINEVINKQNATNYCSSKISKQYRRTS
jgi:hypothetical protein